MPSATTRGYFAGFIDWLVGRRLGLPAELCSYTVEILRIPLKHREVYIEAELYLPTNFDPLGTIFVPTPYGTGFPGSLTLARIYAARGYQVLIGCCRDNPGSKNEFAPGRNEVADNHAIVAWMREQSWYTGSFGTLGGSYMGHNQLALLTDPPKDMKAAVIWTAPHDFGEFIWGTGALNSNIIAWADITTRMARGDGFLSLFLIHLRSQREKLRPTFDSVPLLPAVQHMMEGRMPNWLPKAMSSPDLSDEYWKPMRVTSALQKADIPILLTSGWDDIVLPMVIEQYERLSSRGCDVALTVGPWTHLGCQGNNTSPESLDWLNQHLAHSSPGSRTSPVRIFVTGLREWRDLPKWPPKTTPFELYLSADKRLAKEAPAINASPSTFDFDPHNPTPSVGYPLLFDNGPGRNEGDSILATRSDVLVFETEVLNEYVEICGRPTIELQHSTDHPHADLLVLLSEVNTKGFSRTISEQYLRLPVDRDDESLCLSLTDCAHKFQKGTRIRLIIAGGSHPRYIRNLGTGEDQVQGSKMQVVQHCIRHDASAVSKIVLPIAEIVN